MRPCELRWRQRRASSAGASWVIDALEAGVAVIAGTSFGAQGEGYLRFSYANSTDNITEALARIRAWVGANASR